MSCQNEACKGGMVQVDPEGYAEIQWPIPDDATDEERAALEFKRRHYSEAYRPCQDCRPDQFTRWANGCYRSGHRATRCDLCLEALGEKVASTVDRGAVR